MTGPASMMLDSCEYPGRACSTLSSSEDAACQHHFRGRVSPLQYSIFPVRPNWLANFPGMGLLIYIGGRVLHEKQTRHLRNQKWSNLLLLVFVHHLSCDHVDRLRKLWLRWQDPLPVCCLFLFSNLFLVSIPINFSSFAFKFHAVRHGFESCYD